MVAVVATTKVVMVATTKVVMVVGEVTVVVVVRPTIRGFIRTLIVFYNRVVMTDAGRHISSLPRPVISTPPSVLSHAHVWVPVCEKDSPRSPVHY